MQQLLANPADILPQHMSSHLGHATWSECAFGAADLAVLQDFSTLVLPSDAKCFVKKADSKWKQKPSFISFVKRYMIGISLSPNCVGFDSCSYYLVGTRKVSAR